MIPYYTIVEPFVRLVLGPDECQQERIAVCRQRRCDRLGCRGGDGLTERPENLVALDRRQRAGSVARLDAGTRLFGLLLLPLQQSLSFGDVSRAYRGQVIL